MVWRFSVVPEQFVVQLRDRVERLFEGHFDTGVYPDEWHWRKGISKESATKEIVNAWKS
jgi:phytanoyl-CoA hydroxylase